MKKILKPLGISLLVVVVAAAIWLISSDSVIRDETAIEQAATIGDNLTTTRDPSQEVPPLTRNEARRDMAWNSNGFRVFFPDYGYDGDGDNRPDPFSK